MFVQFKQKLHDSSTNLHIIKLKQKLQAIENAYHPSQSGSHHHQQPQTHQSYGNLSNQQIHYQNSQHSPPNNVLHGSHGNLTNLGNISQSNLGYRSPKCRPSPGSSPGLASSLPNSGDSNTSAPCSPASQGNNGQYDSYYLNPSIQATFEQFSLVDSPVQEYIASQSPNAQNYQYDDVNYSHLNNSMDSMQQHQPQTNTMQQQNSSNLHLSNQKMSNSNVAASQQQQQTISQQQQQQQQLNNSQAPHTPTSIPEIIFTDFSSASELSKDLFGDPLRPIDLELGTMDFAGYQMLTDPNGTMIADPTIEDSFRRDLN
ncbi:hypothetical protein Bhyg_05467 [Pseudolycoriella hygida]|uniref:Transducer of regulated CREB activity C-terminal domain-containing protein n=1 Tax=Pseudolycoriella hygida TaxID=35572 RepID=A0A9Q0MYY0_9DIPT|nr:hypothetical protein Bhyg_05467 [Pseudolycoriella hygida]